jgi:aspartate carbamoyltransferase catalytic subunit
MKHLLGIRQLEESAITEIFSHADRIAREFHDPFYHNHKVMISFFGEPSTRTRFSFEAAAVHLGMRTLTAADASVSSSLKKGETWKDTFRTLGQYGDVIVCRHSDEEFTRAAEMWSRIPVINAGNGHDEHPTQALLDVYTIKKELGHLDNLKVMICGDLRYGRTVNSLSYLLKRYGAHVYYVPAVGLGGWKNDPTELKFYPQMAKCDMPYHEFLDPYIAHLKLEEMDVVYLTRIQNERREDGVIVKDYFKLHASRLKEMKEKSVILHPLPRGDEIDTACDDDPRAAYHERQVRNGLYVRVAILKMLLDRPYN